MRFYEVIRELRHMRDSQARFPASISSIVPNSNDKTKFPLQVPDPVPAESQSDVETALQRTTWRSHTKGESAGYFRSIAEFGAAVADALDFAHQRGIVHRDVKPSNLMIDSAGKAWIADFGLAQIETGTALTRTGDLLGTARYMSPEQIEGKRVILDHRTDIYSLGVTLYELLTLQLPFEADNRQELFRQIAFEEPTRPHRITPSIPEDLETIVLKAMEKVPSDRYESAVDMANDLKRFLDQLPIKSRRATVAQRVNKWSRRNQWLVRSIAIGLVSMTIGLTVFSFLLIRERGQSGKDRLEHAQANLGVAMATLDKIYLPLIEQNWTKEQLLPSDRKLVTEGLELYRQLAGINAGFDDAVIEAGVAYRRLGDLYRLRNDSQAARSTLQESIDLLEWPPKKFQLRDHD